MFRIWAEADSHASVDIAKHYGGTQTASAIEHRFRPLRSAAEAMRIMVKNDQDPALIENVLEKGVVGMRSQHTLLFIRDWDLCLWPYN